MAAATHANPAAARTIVVATVWVHHPTIARSNPSNNAADSQIVRRGDRRNCAPARRPASGVVNSAGSATSASNQRAVRDTQLEVAEQPEVEPEPPAEEPRTPSRARRWS